MKFIWGPRSQDLELNFYDKDLHSREDQEPFELRFISLQEWDEIYDEWDWNELALRTDEGVISQIFRTGPNPLVMVEFPLKHTGQ